MDLLELALIVHESEGAEAAIAAVSQHLAQYSGVAVAIWAASDRADPIVAGTMEPATLTGILPEIRSARDPILRAVKADETGLAAERHLLAIPVADQTGVFAVISPREAIEAGAPQWTRIAEAVATVAGAERRSQASTAAQRRAAELEAAQKELRKSVEEGEVLHTLGLAVNRSLDPEEVLELVARLTRTALGASYVMLSTTEEGTTRTPTAAGLRRDPPVHDPLADRVMQSGRTLRVGHTETLRPEDFEPHAGEEMVLGLGVPLSVYGETIGALVIGYRRPVEITPRHVRLALTLAGHAAVAISNARLHNALARRTAEAEHAYEELRLAAEAKERFFAALSHELRTPLNAILGYHSLILEGAAGNVPAVVEQFVGNAHRAASGLLHLVNDVLDLSKIEAGKVELVLEPVEVRNLMEDALAAVRPMADRRGIELAMVGEAGVPRARTDANRVRQIVVNLLSNAIKFTDEGRVSVSVEVASSGRVGNQEGGVMRIAVRDTGSGIAEEDQQRIFQEFEQIGGARGRDGTGLGLPISRKLARLLGGDLTVRSRLGEGSVFTLTLPLDGPTLRGTPFATDGG